MLYLQDDKSNITVYTGEFYYINGISFTVTVGGIIDFNWIVQDKNMNPFI